MKRLFIITVLFFFWGVFLSSAKVSTGYPDLDLYYSQLEKNRSAAHIARMTHLMKTIPHDRFIRDYMERGVEVMRDTVSLLSFFNHGPVIPSVEERLQLLEAVNAAARKYKSERLRLAANYFNAFLIENKRTLFDTKIEAFEQVISDSRKVGDYHIELFALEEMRGRCASIQQFACSFAYAQRMEDALNAAADDYPHRGFGYIVLGRMYFDFKDYDRALPLFYKSLHKKNHLIQMENVTAWNYLAVYHQMNGNLDSAAYYHRAIIAGEEGLINSPVHLTIAISNLGRIELSQRNNDAAIALLQAGLEAMRQYNELSFIVGLYTSLGEAWLAKGDLVAAKSYIDRVYRERPKFDKILWQQRSIDLFALESRYYAHLGQHELSKLYLDSVQIATRNHLELTGQHFVRLGEQQLQEAEIVLKSQQVAQQKKLIVFILVILAVILGGMLLFIGLYRKKNAACKVLARKAEAWAMQEGAIRKTTPVVSENDNAPLTTDVKTENRTTEKVQEEDLQIMTLADWEMTEQFAYHDTSLTLESLADRLGLYRNALSKAVNQVTGDNFNQYVNSYRVKEAIQIISNNEQKELHVGELFERVGFSSRTSFYRVFKQFTGLSPIEFQKQKEERRKEKGETTFAQRSVGQRRNC